MTSIRGWMEGAVPVLTGRCDSPRREAAFLLAGTMQRSASWIAAHPEAEIPDNIEKILAKNLERLAGGEPLSYITGQREFYGLNFHITPDVLVPRPETELLVEEALRLVKTMPGNVKGVDVGTGSGCISVALLANCRTLRMTLVDISRGALQVARRNLELHAQSGRASLVQGDLLEAFLGRFDLVCANLPYIPADALAKLSVKNHEPRLALDGGADGLDLIRRLVCTLPGLLTPRGAALLEIEAGQGKDASELARAAFPVVDVQVLPDLSGRARLLKIRNAG